MDYRKLAERLHQDHFRRDGTTPYFTHLEKTVSILTMRGCVDPITIGAAWLHDSIEDYRCTYLHLIRDGVCEEVIDLIKLLTKAPGLDYFAYLHSIRDNDQACQIKIADMLANLSDSPTDKQIKKYAIGLQFLLSDD